MGNLQNNHDGSRGADDNQGDPLSGKDQQSKQQLLHYFSSSASPQRNSKEKHAGVAQIRGAFGVQRGTISLNSHPKDDLIPAGTNLKATFRNSDVGLKSFQQQSLVPHQQKHQQDQTWRLPVNLVAATLHKDFDFQQRSPAKPPAIVTSRPQQQNQESFGGQTTIPLWTKESSSDANGTCGSIRGFALDQTKRVRVYVDKEIEFSIALGGIAANQLTCGWLLSEVTRRYMEALTQLKRQENNGRGIKKYTRKMIVALKTTDQRESLDYWLTQYDRSLEVLQDSDFLIAHFAKMRDPTLRINQEHTQTVQTFICKEDFQQIKVIGRGGFSRVVLARKKDTGRLYALKIMKKSRIVREKKLKPILSERQILELLQTKHPFLIKLHWAFQSPDELFFVMDVCTGGELFYHLSKLKRLSEHAAKFYFAEILLGLEHLHSLNIVYRDIKPENILLDIDGHIRIADFGLSKIIPHLHKSYSFCGSPEYMSPEMLACVGHDKRLDIYCLGALLFEMLTGLPPFYSRDDTQGMYERIMNEEVILPSDILHSHPNSHNQIQSLLSRLMQKDPMRRYQTLQEVKRHPWLQDVPWEALLAKRPDLQPPIVPNVRESHIDPDYTELPLDFEEEHPHHHGSMMQQQRPGRLSTAERRYSYYYESTLQSKRSIALNCGDHQSFFNQFFEKNDSSLSLKVPRQGVAVNQGSSNFEDHNSSQNHDGASTHFDNFTFIDVPREELEVLRTLKHKTQHQRPVVINPDHIYRREPPPPTLVQNSVIRGPANQQDQEILIADEQLNSRNLGMSVPRVVEEDQQLLINSALINGTSIGPQGLIQQTASNGSVITFYDESNQSIAQEFTPYEGIAQVFPTGQPQTVGAILEVFYPPDGALFSQERYTELLLPPSYSPRDAIKEEGEQTLRSDLSESPQNLNTITEESKDKNVSPIQVEKHIVIGKAINIKENLFYQTLKSTGKFNDIIQEGAIIPSKISTGQDLGTQASQTFQTRTQNQLQNKSSSTIVSPKLSMTAQTPSKDVFTNKKSAFMTASNTRKQREQPLSESKMAEYARGSSNTKSSTSKKQNTLMPNGSIVRESFTIDAKPTLIHSDKASEQSISGGAQKLQRTHFNYSHLQKVHKNQSSSSPRKQPGPSKRTKGAAPQMTANNTHRSLKGSQNNRLTSTQSNAHISKSGLPSSNTRAPPQKATLQKPQYSIGVKSNPPPIKSLLQIANNSGKPVKISYQPPIVGPQNSNDDILEAFQQVPTTTENNQEEDEYNGEMQGVKPLIARGGPYLQAQVEYTIQKAPQKADDSQVQQRTMKFKSIETILHHTHNYKSPGSKVTSSSITGGAPASLSYQSAKSTTAQQALVVGQQQQQQFQTFQRLLFQGAQGPGIARTQMPGSDLSVGGGENEITKKLQQPATVLNNPAKLYQSINHPNNFGILSTKKQILDQSSKLVQGDESLTANKSSLVIGTQVNLQPANSSPGQNSTTKQQLFQRRYFESSFDMTGKSHHQMVTPPQEDGGIQEYMPHSPHHHVQNFIVPTFQASGVKSGSKTNSKAKGTAANVFQTPKQSISLKLFEVSNQPIVQTSSNGAATPVGNQSMVSNHQQQQQQPSLSQQRRLLIHSSANTAKSQLNINVITNGGGSIIARTGSRDQRGPKYLSRNGGQAMKANTAKAINTAKI